MSKGAKRKWTLEKIQKEANKYETRGDFQDFSRKAYDAARYHRCLNIVCINMPEHISMAGENNPAFKWTFEKLQEEALKFNNRSEFQNNNASAYAITIRRDDKEIILRHMPPHIDCSGKNNSNFKWTDEYLASIALKYSNRREFYKKDSNFFNAACRRGILNQICSHMTDVLTHSYMELELLKIIKNYFPSAKTLKDRKVKIEHKPYIKGFDIDIFIPELKLGIEFDGTWWHSFEFMRYDSKKAKWSDDDIINYHEIKDAWFASKGIKILHIKEEDWIANKNLCVKQCLKFLKD